MADEKPEQIKPEEESKKDTVRINLPPGLTSRAPATQPIPAPPPPPPVKPAAAVAVTDDEAKKQTAVMGKPVTAPKPKTDTSRVQVPGAKAAEEAKPGLKLKREGEPAAAPVAAAAPAVAVAPSGPNPALSVVSMLLAIAVTLYLAWLTLG
jgi:hypothetical protein